MIDELKIRGIRRFNIFMGLLHLVQGLIMLLMSSSFALPVTSAFLNYDPVASKLAPTLDTLFTFRIGPMVAIFLLLSAAAHLLVSSPSIYQWYARNLARGINHARWMEYSLSASVMIVVIALLVGIYDIASLIMIFALNTSMILFGWVMEVHNQKTDKVNWISYWFGVFAGAIPWVAIGLYLFGSGNEAGGPPTFVYWIFFSIFIFFNTFAINMVLQYKKVGKWRDYLYGERSYIVLSLVAKSLLAWQVWGGTLRPV